MKTLQEALSKSRIKQIKPRIGVFKSFTKNDLETGDLLYDRRENHFWMVLTGNEPLRRLAEFKGDWSSDVKRAMDNYESFVVCPVYPKEYLKMYNIFRRPFSRLYNKNGHLISENKDFIVLIKCDGMYYDINKTIQEIFAENNDFNEYKNMIF